MKLTHALGFTTLGFLGGFLIAVYVAILHEQNVEWFSSR